MGYRVFLTRKDANANTGQLGEFAVYLFTYGMNRKYEGNQHTTIASKISAIRWYHLRLCGFQPEVHGGHQLLMKGLRRCSKPVAKKHPLTNKMLRKLHGLMDLNLPGHQLLWGSMLLAYFFLLRRSEFLKVDGNWYKSVLRLVDVQYYNNDEDVCCYKDAAMVGIILRGAKNNQYGRKEVRYQFKTGDPILCPVSALFYVRKAAGHFGTDPYDPMVSMGMGRGLSNSHVVKTLKFLASSMGLNPKDYSSHSIRIGGSITLLNNGAAPLVIKMLGRWLSNCFESYPVLLASGSRGISKLMC